MMYAGMKFTGLVNFIPSELPALQYEAQENFDQVQKFEPNT